MTTNPAQEARDELTAILHKRIGGSVGETVRDVLAAGYRKPEVRIEWAAAHAANGVVYNFHPTREEAQEFIDSMAEVDHAMLIMRREYTPATFTEWEPQP